MSNLPSPRFRAQPEEAYPGALAERSRPGRGRHRRRRDFPRVPQRAAQVGVQPQPGLLQDHQRGSAIPEPHGQDAHGRELHATLLLPGPDTGQGVYVGGGLD